MTDRGLVARPADGLSAARRDADADDAAERTCRLAPIAHEHVGETVAVAGDEGGRLRGERRPHAVAADPRPHRLGCLRERIGDAPGVVVVDEDVGQVVGVGGDEVRGLGIERRNPAVVGHVGDTDEARCRLWRAVAGHAGPPDAAVAGLVKHAVAVAVHVGDEHVGGVVRVTVRTEEVGRLRREDDEPARLAQARKSRIGCDIRRDAGRRQVESSGHRGGTGFVEDVVTVGVAVTHEDLPAAVERHVPSGAADAGEKGVDRGRADQRCRQHTDQGRRMVRGVRIAAVANEHAFVVREDGLQTVGAERAVQTVDEVPGGVQADEGRRAQEHVADVDAAVRLERDEVAVAADPWPGRRDPVGIHEFRHARHAIVAIHVWRREDTSLEEVGGFRFEHDVAAVVADGGSIARSTGSIRGHTAGTVGQARDRAEDEVLHEDVGLGIRVLRTEVAGIRREDHEAAALAHRRRVAEAEGLDIRRRQAAAPGRVCLPVGTGNREEQSQEAPGGDDTKGYRHGELRGPSQANV